LARAVVARLARGETLALKGRFLPY
jgi:hypothetical protein